jgi:hypothetical protein
LSREEVWSQAPGVLGPAPLADLAAEAAIRAIINMELD